jgi:16S rRNA (guanine527-N7)-methyltransferase
LSPTAPSPAGASEPADSAELRAIFSALDLSPQPAQLAALLAYLDLLQRWNATYNLTAVRERGAMISQHLADCLAIIAPLRRHRAQGRLLDVGSGGGLPGVVIAALLPDLEVSCVDAVGKKVAFVRQVAGALQLSNLQGVHARVEDLKVAAFDVITSRAFATLERFVSLTERHLATDGVWLAMKGRLPEEEMAALPPFVEVFHVEQLVVPTLDSQRCLVWMRRRTPA